MAAKPQAVRSVITDDAPMNAAEVAKLLGYQRETAQKWIASHATRLKAWKTGPAGGRWRLMMSDFKRCCKQLGIKIKV